MKKHKEYSMLLGRYQCLPPHEGHCGLIKQLIKEKRNILLALRKNDGTEKNPYNFEQRKEAFEKLFKNEIKDGKIKIIEIDDVTEVIYGRTPGWGIRQIKLDEATEAISATKIREENK